MVRITEDMIRKRSEHNECEIYSLEELSLHQHDIDKIEYLQNWCKQLQILYLQNNLITKIENVGKLKKLEYLNLALNNVERIENLEGCESLKKLDLTVNFVGELTTIDNLKSNIFLEELYLVGNPCANYDGYREYVCATLPQLKKLDGQEIEKSQRIKALQEYGDIREKILDQEAIHKIKRKEQLNQNKEKQERTKNREEMTEEEKRIEEEEFWKEESDYTPESRTEIQNRMRENKNKSTPSRFEQKKEKRKIRFFNDAGNPLNVNQAKIEFSLTESDDDCSLLLDVACYKYLDTSLIDLDVQPWYARVTIKDKFLQIALNEEVKPDSCIAQRSQITGHLLVTMPKLNPPEKPKPRPTSDGRKHEKKREVGDEKSNFLEVNEEKKSIIEKLANIANGDAAKSQARKPVKPKQPEPEVYDDDPDVPPLI